MTKFFAAIFLGLSCCCLMSGCADTKTADSEAADHDDHDHGHDDHDHGHEGHDHGDHEGHDHGAHDIHGPFGGHTFAFDSDDFRAEWKHYSDNDVIRVYVLDTTGQKEAPVNATVVMIPLGGSDRTPFELEAEKPDEEGKSAVYSLDDKNLGIAITAVGVKVEMKTDGKTYSAIIDAHEPHDH
jgi:hypothetical protein